MNSLDYKFDFRDERNLSLVMDFYELTMSQCYFNSDHRDRIVTFDLFIVKIQMKAVMRYLRDWKK